jgi:predicted TIM-barrel fold metal-dependent hydrolase
MIFHERALEGLDEPALDEETHRLYLHENASRVFGLPQRLAPA